MTLPEANNSCVNSREPPWMERVRRIGWGLMLLSIAAMAIARLGPQALHVAAVVVAFAAGSLGLLAIINVAMVSALYKRVDIKLAETKEGE